VGWCSVAMLMAAWVRLAWVCIALGFLWLAVAWALS
jgi:hypothetical protein